MHRPPHIVPLVLLPLLAAAPACSPPPPPPEPTTETTDMPDDALTHHGISYIEFTVTDMAEAKAFYAAAFDWEFNDYGPDYAGIKKGDGEAGGFRLDSTVTRGGPLIILYSNDLEATVERVRQAGGVIVTEPFSFPGGRRFHFTDPSGNELAVWSDK